MAGNRPVLAAIQNLATKIDDQAIRGLHATRNLGGFAGSPSTLGELSDEFSGSFRAVFAESLPDIAAQVSFVLRAMGVPTEYALGTLRLSVGRHTTRAELRAAAAAIVGSCAK